MSVFAARVAIADANFQRVTVYGVPAPMPTLPLHADGVLGQRGLDQAVNTPALSSLYNPAAVMTDGHQTFVADKSNNRVLVYNQFFAAVGMYGPAAFAALGQPLPDRIKTPPDIGPADLNQPAGVALAVIGGKTVLFVADQGNHRVQVFYRPQ